jgi:hypothetical protein
MSSSSLQVVRDSKETKRRKQESASEKWRHMLKIGFQRYMEIHPRKVRTRVQQGIPDCFRGEVWQGLVRSRHFAEVKQQNQPCIYQVIDYY